MVNKTYYSRLCIYVYSIYIPTIYMCISWRYVFIALGAMCSISSCAVFNMLHEHLYWFCEWMMLYIWCMRYIGWWANTFKWIYNLLSMWCITRACIHSSDGGVVVVEWVGLRWVGWIDGCGVLYIYKKNRIQAMVAWCFIYIPISYNITLCFWCGMIFHLFDCLFACARVRLYNGS